jgi:hypothetical protein
MVRSYWILKGKNRRKVQYEGSRGTKISLWGLSYFLSFEKTKRRGIR